MRHADAKSWSKTATDRDVSCSGSYPELESAYLKRKYGSDDFKQLEDRHAKEGLSRYCLPERRKELRKILKIQRKLKCENLPGLKPGRHAIIRSQIKDHLSLYEGKSIKSFEWNEHFQEAVRVTAEEVVRFVKRNNSGRLLKPITLRQVTESESFSKNASKHAGFMAFETGRRKKVDNYEEAVKWLEENKENILKNKFYGIPCAIAHRSSNSQISDWSLESFKARCRAVIMEDVRTQIANGRFQIPFNSVVMRICWSEGGMSHEELQNWMDHQRANYKYWYSSDYSKFDVSQSDWLIQTAFYKIIRPCFDLGDEDEALFQVMVNSYINKEIHGFDRVYHSHRGTPSGSLWTYWINTIVNVIIDRTVLLMTEHDPMKTRSLKCGDDNIVFHNFDDFDPDKHKLLIEKYFGIKTTLDEKDCGKSMIDAPVFLSRTWTFGGASRPIEEVVFNLIHPERFRDYHEISISERKAVALLLLCAVIDQPAIMRRWFDVDAIKRDSGVGTVGMLRVYRELEKLGGGFVTQKIHFRLGLLTDQLAA